MNALGQDTDRAAQVAATQQLGQHVFGFGMAAQLALMALGPRPDDPEHWFNVYAPPWLWLLIAGVAILTSLHDNLLPAAKVTAECDDVRAELNLLRYEDGKLSYPDTLTRVEALERYIDSKGLGYHMLGVRISYSFVYGVLVQAFSVLSVVLPVLLVQLQDLVPVESASASLSGGD